MVLNSIKDLKEINGKPILVMDELREKYPEKFNELGSMDYKWFEENIRPNYNIYVRHDVDSISFNMLTKPVSEGGDLNRCQWSDVVTMGLEMLKYFNDKFPCRENALTITKLEEALMWNEKRTQDRIKRNVEGQNKP
jgi:RNA recognition motif-containing protein